MTTNIVQIKLNNISNMETDSVANDNVETNSNNGEQQEPQIKLERFETWECPPEIDLISDDGNEDGLPGISGNDQAPSAPAALHATTGQANGSAKRRIPGRADLLALQQKLADKYRTMSGKKTKKPPTPEPEPESESEDEDAKFLKAKKNYQRRHKANKVSVEEEIEFMRLEGEFMARKRKRDADAEWDDSPSETPEDDAENGLFVSNDDRFAPRFPGADSDDETPPPKKRARGRGKKVLGQDYTEDDVTEVIRDARRQSAKSKAKPATKPKPKPKGKAAPKKGKKDAAGTQLTNLSHLFGGDVFKDTAANASARSQPTFEGATRKNDAMKKLIASVPQESTHVSRADMKHLDAAIKEFTGQGSVSAAPDGNWQVKGMRSTLKHFQVLGSGFMRQRETQDAEPRGGILADEMGLGKTIMMLANIINGRPQGRSKTRTTLVVASPALVSQWFKEIRDHCHTKREHKHGLGKVMVYKAGNRIQSNDDIAYLEESDIVLTTYYEVSKSYPKAVIPPEKVTAHQKEEWWRDHYEQEKGILHRIKFLRVCLDEAQAIKNRSSHTSIACRALQARHRWCITGTPLLNSISEMYPYLAFIREPHTGSYKIFKHNFCGPNDPDGKDKLGVLLRRVMIRRGHMDRMFDAKLVDLPPPSETTIWLELNEIERSIYEIVKTRFIEHINAISKRGNLQKSYSHIWVLILRLRQLCAHTLMIGDTCLDLLERSDYEQLNKITACEEKTSDEGAALLIHLRQVLRNTVDHQKEVDATLAGTIMQQNEGEYFNTGLVDINGDEEDVGNQFGLNFRFRKYLEDFRHSDHWDNMVQRTTCCGCRQQPNDPYLTSCYHIYCRCCLEELQHMAARRGHDQARCAECGSGYTATEPLEDTPVMKLSNTSESDGNLNQKGKKKPAFDWIAQPGPVLPSAKTAAVKAAVMNFFQDDPDTKIIIYTQWNPMVRILSKVCDGEGWGWVKYTGGMSTEAKEKAVHEFSTKPNVNILIAGLKCGGLGLNLTAATKVLLIDPWWNKAIEQQAFCRVFRIGQTSRTSLTRFVCRNTIDEAMMQVKDKKQMEIDELMNNSKLSEKLTVEDLMRLFGKVEEDEEGKPFIFADAESDDGVPRLADMDDENEFGFMRTDE